MTNALSKLISIFRSRPQAETHSFSREESQDFSNLPPGFVPIESLYDMAQIPGTSRHLGAQLRIFETPGQELTTANRRIGIRCGCGHLIYRIEQRVTPEAVEQGVGGACLDCTGEAEDLLKQGLISISQAEEMALYCTDCASHCQHCLRSNLCIRHTRIFQESATSHIPLCSVCYEKAQRQRFLKQTITTVLAPFIDQHRLP